MVARKKCQINRKPLPDIISDFLKINFRHFNDDFNVQVFPDDLAKRDVTVSPDVMANLVMMDRLVTLVNKVQLVHAVSLVHQECVIK